MRGFAAAKCASRRSVAVPPVADKHNVAWHAVVAIAAVVVGVAVQWPPANKDNICNKSFGCQNTS